MLNESDRNTDKTMSGSAENSNKGMGMRKGILEDIEDDLEN